MNLCSQNQRLGWYSTRNVSLQTYEFSHLLSGNSIQCSRDALDEEGIVDVGGFDGGDVAPVKDRYTYEHGR